MRKQYKVDNAIIMAAGISSRFVPISYELPKALLEVKGEILIERQIKQLKDAGIEDITIVVGYKKELFKYLIGKFNVKIIENPEYNTRNNNSSLFYAREELRNTYICSADNYFVENIFRLESTQSYYSAVFEEEDTDEWCIVTDENGLIIDVNVGGKNSWIMLGHAFFSEDFSREFTRILEKTYKLPETADLLWEGVFIKHISDLHMYIKKYSKETIFEFDTLDELRRFDEKYYNDTKSKTLKRISKELQCDEGDITSFEPINRDEKVMGFKFVFNGKGYQYNYTNREIVEEKDSI